VSLSRWNHRQRRKKAYGDKTAKKQFAKHDCPLVQHRASSYGSNAYGGRACARVGPVCLNGAIGLHRAVL
jgi:hypothetical protein